MALSSLTSSHLCTAPLSTRRSFKTRLNSNPHATTPSCPHATTPSRPQATTPSRPHATTPSSPHATTPSRPHATTSIRPHPAESLTLWAIASFILFSMSTLSAKLSLFPLSTLALPMQLLPLPKTLSTYSSSSLPVQLPLIIALSTLTSLPFPVQSQKRIDGLRVGGPRRVRTENDIFIGAGGKQKLECDYEGQLSPRISGEELSRLDKNGRGYQVNSG